MLSYEENVAEVKRAVQFCHFYGILVEAELGALQGKEEDIVNEADAKTDPGCDLLAVSVGNVHGLELMPHVDLELLQTIADISPVPLVLHGGSGIPFDTIQKARKCGLLKINYGSDLRKEFIRTFGEAYESSGHTAHDVISLSMKAVENVSQKAQELVTVINA